VNEWKVGQKILQGGLLVIMGGKGWTKYRRKEKFGVSDVEHSVPYTGVVQYVRHGLQATEYELQFDRACDVGLDYAPRQLFSSTSY
jgi:hypothetical protein